MSVSAVKSMFGCVCIISRIICMLGMYIQNDFLLECCIIHKGILLQKLISALTKAYISDVAFTNAPYLVYLFFVTTDITMQV